MRVLCIQSANFLNGKPTNGGPKENELYSVINTFEENGMQWHELAEFGNYCCFQAEMFIPLSDIDEMELVKEREVAV